MQDSQIPADKAGEIDVNPAMALERIDAWLDGFIRLIPNIIVAILVVVTFWLLSKLVKRLVTKNFKSRDRSNLGEVLGGFMKAITLAGGIMLAAMIISPTLKLGDLVAGLGIGSVAIGFAFKDILQNWLAGLLILIRQPFEIGDQIKVGEYEGTVQHIETRATIVTTYDGQRAVIPNSDIYTNAVLVKTGNDFRRSQYDIGIGYADDIDAACEIILREINKIEGVETKPAAEAFAWDLAASWVTIRARWWCKSHRSDVVMMRSHVIRAVKLALDDAKIDMPYDTRVHLFHDQTEETDGDRNAQREGWPAPHDGAPSPRYKVLGKGGTSDPAIAEPRT
ncbi:mechanosensitive ion channel family protein [Robiginitomaculum antarcticum]|uniref:mechanosensitive ion channel family protein n=1 Tax=Robiginitomaculum antarcticum TaxID=437507 RepID=UPI000369C5A2|nr:mechanosensitive ion channel family protein [Robiginitomaculum antarcticum]